jgi:hypothetical protein
MLDPFLVIPAIAIGYYSNSLLGLAKGLGILVLLVQCVVFVGTWRGDGWDSRLLAAAFFGGMFYLAAARRRRWRHGEL